MTLNTYLFEITLPGGQTHEVQVKAPDAELAFRSMCEVSCRTTVVNWELVGVTPDEGDEE